MSQLVFIHGPGAGGCADSYVRQLEHFPGSLAPSLPGHLEGEAVPRHSPLHRVAPGWLWSQDRAKDLVLVGFTLGACIGLQYALDYPEEVKALALMTVAMRPKVRAPGTLDMRLNAAKDPKVYEEWLEFQRHAMMFVESELREHLMDCHAKVGPISQYRDLVTIDKFDVRDRIDSLRAPLLLIRGVDDPGAPPEYELEIHQAVPGSRYLKLSNAGHFPAAEQPQQVNQAIEEFLRSIPD